MTEVPPEGEPTNRSALERFRVLVGDDPSLMAIASQISESESRQLADTLVAYWGDDVVSPHEAALYQVRGSEPSDGSGLTAVLERAGWSFRVNRPVTGHTSDADRIEFELELEAQMVLDLGPTLGATVNQLDGSMSIDAINVPDRLQVMMHLANETSISLGVHVSSLRPTTFAAQPEQRGDLVIGWRRSASER